jgi:16S rRNA (cytosine967-C5)-methyltransferase
VTPAARVQAAIELLQQIVDAAKGQGAPADRILADWFKARRFPGSKDRRAIRELVYRAIRACGPIPQTGRAAMLRLVEDDPSLLLAFDGSAYGPAPVEEGELIAEGGVAPAWLAERLASSGIEGAEAEALLERAPLDIRVNALKADRGDMALPVVGEPLPSAQGLRLPYGTPVEQWPQYADGLIEVQDCGSQLACEAVAARPRETVIDLCAGAGGKTLALAAAMGNEGTLIAADTDRGRLSRLSPRAQRANATVAETLLLDPGREAEALAKWAGQADAVLVDAPCSGTGTWRRNPELRWRLTPERLERLARTQAELLDLAARLVRPGGLLVYAVCSLLAEEGRAQADSFTRRSAFIPDEDFMAAGRSAGTGRLLTPAHDRTDGFFVARWRGSC